MNCSEACSTVNMPLLELRNINVRRIGYVASETTKNRGIAICAP